MSEPERPSEIPSSPVDETQEIEPLLRRLDQPSDVSRALLFCASLASIGFIAAQNFDLMTTWQAALNVLAGAAFALALMVVFFQWDMREGVMTGAADAPSGFRAYLAPIKTFGFVKAVRRQRYDRLSFAFILIGIVLTFAAKLGRMPADTHV